MNLRLVLFIDQECVLVLSSSVCYKFKFIYVKHKSTYAANMIFICTVVGFWTKCDVGLSIDVILTHNEEIISF
jgi:hypothetical protein